MPETIQHHELPGSPADCQRVVLISGHYLESRRKAGFHWLAEAYWQAGWDVTFVTAAVSHLSRLRRDFRLEYPLRDEANAVKSVRERLSSFVLYTPYHPANLRVGCLNRISAPLFRRYAAARLGPLADVLRRADLIIFESTPGLLLFKQVRELNPRARSVYRVSDDLRLLGNHPVVLEAERAWAPAFDLVSVPTASMRAIFSDRANVAVHPHGIQAELFDRPAPNPFPPGLDLVFVGVSRFDHDFLARASRLRPDARFHVIGPIPDIRPAPNVVTYGEMPFAETIPYLKHAGAGLHTLAWEPGAEAFADSLKVQQYSYCGLGIVAPEFLASPRPNVCTYTPGDDRSIAAAIDQAVACTRRGFPAPGILSWHQLAARLAG